MTEPTLNTTDNTTPTTDTAPISPETTQNTAPEGQNGAVSDQNQPQTAPQKDMFGNVVPPAYTPNFKYKYLSGDGSNRVEKEFPEFLRGIIKDEATEKQLRELHERAYGLDFVKADRQKQKERADQVEAQYTQQTQGLQRLAQVRDEKDYDTMLEMLGVSEDDFLQHAVKVAQRRQNPQAAEAYNQQRQASRQVMTLEQENAQLKAQAEQYAVQMKTQELDGMMSRQDIAQVAQSFDDRVGSPGAFRNEVIKRGQLYAAQGQDISVEQAVGEVLSIIGAQPNVQTNQTAVGQTPPPAAVPPQQSKPVIPHIAGKGTSPTKRIPKSTADLRAMAATMSAEG